MDQQDQPADQRLEGLRILIVEDTVLLADAIADQLRAHGCVVVGPAGRLDRALKLAKAEELDGTLLDLNLAGEFSFPVATVLTERGIPFIILTGYENLSIIPPQFRGVPRLQKPFYPDHLTDLIGRTFSSRKNA